MRKHRGIVLIETLLILPVVLWLILSLVLGLRLWSQSGALNDVALYAARLAAADTNLVQVFARKRASELQLRPEWLLVNVEELQGGASATVRYPMSPGWFAKSLLWFGVLPWLEATQTAYARPNSNGN